MSNEIWQVEVGGQVYEASFAELPSWIGEGSLHPEDKVRRGNLRWIEARRVPTLVPFFNAKERGLLMPVLFSTTDAGEAGDAVAQKVVADNFQTPPVTPVVSATVIPDPIEHSVAVPIEQAAVTHDPNFCALHTDVPTVYLCDGCGTGFCKVCPKAYGGSVRLCPLCGALCRMMKE